MFLQESLKEFNRTTADKDACNDFLYVAAGLIFMFSSWANLPGIFLGAGLQMKQAASSPRNCHYKSDEEVQRFLYASIEGQMSSPSNTPATTNSGLYMGYISSH